MKKIPERLTLKLLTSPSCALCRPGMFIVQRIKEESDGFDLHIINIKERKYIDKYGHFCEEIPVLMKDEVVLVKTRFVETEVRRIIKEALESGKDQSQVS